MASPALLAMPQNVQSKLKQSRTKFNACFQFTKPLVRSISTPPHFTYPDDSIITDLVMLWSILSDVIEIADLKNEDAAIRQDHRLLDSIDTIFKEGGEYWESPGRAVGALQRANWASTAQLPLKGIMKTLRNGNAHVNWAYDNVSATDYWQIQGWDTARALPAFGLRNRGINNYQGYVADAIPPFEGINFWGLSDLRILVIPYGSFRYHVHGFLNVLLNNDQANVFNVRPRSSPS